MTTSSDESLPPRSTLLTNLTTQTSLLTTLFTLLSQPSSSSATSTSKSNPHSGVSGTNSTSIPALYSALEAQTAQMRSMTQNLYTHQKAWAGLKRKEAEVRALEERVRGLVRELERGRGELEGLVKDGRGVKKGIEGLEKAPLSLQTVFSLSRSLSKTTSAPTSTTLPPHLKSASQPYPGETSMRQGILFMEMGAMGGMGDTEVMPAGMVFSGNGAAEEGGVDGEGYGREEGLGGYGGGMGGGMEDVEYREEERRGGAGVFDLDLNSDSEDDD